MTNSTLLSISRPSSPACSRCRELVRRGKPQRDDYCIECIEELGPRLETFE